MSALRERLERFLAWTAGASAGRELARELMTVGSSERGAWLLARRERIDFHALNAILDIAYDHLDDAPKEALELAGLVIGFVHETTSGSNLRDALLRQAHGRAWQEHGNALRQLGDLLGALRSFGRAAVIFAADEISQVELAAVKRGEALVRHQLGESEAALELLRTPMQVLAAHGETAGVVRSHLYEGVIQFENDRFESAAASFEAALRLARRLGDEKTIARLYLNLGNCALERGNRTAAIRDLGRALEFFERAGMLADRKRAAWAMAQMLADDGFVDRAIQALDAVAEEMLLSGLPLDAAMARRDIVEVLVLAERHDRAAEVARGVLDVFAKAGMFREATNILRLLSGHAGLDVQDSRKRGGTREGCVCGSDQLPLLSRRSVMSAGTSCNLCDAMDLGCRASRPRPPYGGSSTGATS